MMIAEQHRIILHEEFNIGIIRLNKCPVAESIKMQCEGEEIIQPEIVCRDGLLIWSSTQMTEASMKAFDGEVTISFEEATVTKEMLGCNSVEGINKSLETVESFLSMLENRRILYKYFDVELNEFAICSCAKLCKDGSVSLITLHYPNPWINPFNPKSDYYVEMQTVEKYEEFEKKIKPGLECYFMRGSLDDISILKGSLICPCCKEKFTVKDILNFAYRIILRTGEFWHAQCRAKYKELNP